MPTSPRGLMPTPTTTAFQRPSFQAPIDAADELGQDAQHGEHQHDDGQAHIEQGAEVDVGASDGKEEGHEDAEERPEPGLDLLAHGCLGDDEADHEGADDGREADEGRQ